MVLYTVGVVAMVNIQVVAMVLYIQCEWLLWFYIYSVSGCYGFIYIQCEWLLWLIYEWLIWLYIYSVSGCYGFIYTV